MADDQATLGTFADGDDDSGESDDAGSEDTVPTATAGTPDNAGAAGDSGTESAADPPDALSGDLVCPWCLASAESFVEAGLTGRACGRCSAVLPVDADWFRARDVIARRPMYEVEE